MGLITPSFQNQTTLKKSNKLIFQATVVTNFGKQEDYKLKKSLMENFIFCAVFYMTIYSLKFMCFVLLL